MSETAKKPSTMGAIQSLLALAAWGVTFLLFADIDSVLGGEADASTQSGFSIETASNRPDMLSGGDVLVRIGIPSRLRSDQVRIILNQRDVSSAFRADAQGLTGVVTDMQLGDNTLTVSEEGSAHPAHSVTLRNHPIEGPVFSGPHQQPFVCETEKFELQVIGGDLGKPLDGNCSIKTRVDYFYRSTDHVFKPLPNSKAAPKDLATTTTLADKTVPYIVRMETGTINRAIYQIMMLHDPRTEANPDPWTRPAGWNGRLLYRFEGACNGGWNRQGSKAIGDPDHFLLGNGFAVASSSLNIFGQNCQDVSNGESMMMVKERFIEAYGEPMHTIGMGCSAGSYPLHQLSDNYPGLLDGIIPGCSYPELHTGIATTLADSRLLQNYFNKVASIPFSHDQKRAITGFVNLKSMEVAARSAGRLVAGEFCDALPPEQRYNAKSNPQGVRCNVYDHNINVFGRDPSTGFARRVLDNLGIQYGLQALTEGVISVDQFLDLNEKIGGYDNDGNIVPRRAVADREALKAAYRTGRVLNAGAGLREVPIVDYRAYQDDDPAGQLHWRYTGFSTRERLIKANGNADNFVMLVEDSRYGMYSTASPLLQEAVKKIDQWLVNVHADKRPGSQAEKVVRNKPADLTDACWTRDANPAKIIEKQSRSEGRCAAIYPSAALPRVVAGSSSELDILKCQLKPVGFNDYKVEFTPAQHNRLKAIFLEGVCDWSKPGVEQQPLTGTWLRF